MMDVMCINNNGYPVSLELKKIYKVIPDEDSERHGMIRIVDETGEDYIYSKSMFVEVG